MAFGIEAQKKRQPLLTKRSGAGVILWQVSMGISRVLSRVVIYLGWVLQPTSCEVPHQRLYHTLLATDWVYLANPNYLGRGGLLPHLFTLTLKERLFSVALSLSLR